MDKSPPVLRTGPTYSENPAKQGKPNALPATASEPQGTLLAQWVKECGESECPENLEQPLYEEMQMTANGIHMSGAGASSPAEQMWGQAN